MLASNVLALPQDLKSLASTVGRHKEFDCGILLCWAWLFEFWQHASKKFTLLLKGLGTEAELVAPVLEISEININSQILMPEAIVDLGILDTDALKVASHRAIETLGV